MKQSLKKLRTEWRLPKVPTLRWGAFVGLDFIAVAQCAQVLILAFHKNSLFRNLWRALFLPHFSRPFLETDDSH